MKKKQPVTMQVMYFPKKGKEKSLRALIEKHGKTLRKTGLITDEPVRVWRAVDKRGHGSEKPYFVEMFQWRDEDASRLAHQTPAVMAVWEPMDAVMESMALAKLDLVATTD